MQTSHILYGSTTDSGAMVECSKEGTITTYPQAIEYLYSRLPMFQQIGSKAYKEGLENTWALDAYLHHPHRKYKTIHVAGTNGKGSVSHALAAILQSQGYKVGLYTSPHLLDFRERIRVNGEMCSKEFVVKFINCHKVFFEPLSPSFFEVTTLMALDYFRSQEVEIAVIEVGLGGRLDCTNIITPILSIITNISLDHTAILGDTVEKIAVEKSGIIKASVPVVIGEKGSESLQEIFLQKAKDTGAPIIFAQDQPHPIEDTEMELKGIYQVQNKNTILSAITQLQTKIRIDETAIRNGLSNISSLTGLMGRWQKLQDHPLVIADTGHNKGGFEYICRQLRDTKADQLRIVLGCVQDKDHQEILSLLPPRAVYYFTKPALDRGLDEKELQLMGALFQLKGDTFATVKEAVAAALREASENDFIFIGGSTFVVADSLPIF